MPGVGRLTAGSIRHTKLVLTAWVVAVAIGGGVGFLLPNPFAATELLMPGTESARWQQMQLDSRFGTNVNVLLRGPPKDVTAQGRLLAKRLRADRRFHVLSPFTGQQGRRILRPSPDVAIVVVQVAQRPGEPIVDSVPPVRTIAERSIRPPVRGHVGGAAAIGRGVTDEGFKAAEEAELIALPILTVILLIVFRSPVAAAIPAVVGLATVAIGTGLATTVARIVPIDATAASMAGIMGLALGVDYSLLLVARFRENRRARAPGTPAESLVALAGATAGRTVAFAAILLVAEMLAALILSPGGLLLSAATGTIAVTLVAAATSLCVTPCLIVLFAAHMERWRLGRESDSGSLAGRAATRIIDRYRAVPVIAAIALLALAVPALGLETGSLDAAELPEGSQVRADAMEYERALGPGFGTSFNVLVRSRRGPITTPARLRALERLQRSFGRDPAVEFIVGPAALASPARRISGLQDQVASTTGRLQRAGRSANRFREGLENAGRDIATFRSLILDARTRISTTTGSGAEALSASGRLARVLTSTASDLATARRAVARARSGSGQLENAIARAGDGVGRIAAALGQLEAGVDRARRAGNALVGRLREGADGLAALRAPASTTIDQLEIAYERLQTMSVGRADPQYSAALEAVATASAAASGRDPRTGEFIDPRYPGLERSLTIAADGLAGAVPIVQRSVKDTARLREALKTLRSGASQLAGGLDKVHDAQGQLTAGLGAFGDRLSSQAERFGQLGPGAKRLAASLASVSAEGTRLDGLLGEGTTRMALLDAGIQANRTRLDEFDVTITSANETARNFRQVQVQSPGFARSGYLALAGIDGARAVRRHEAEFVVNAESGGQYGHLLVVPRDAANSDGVRELGAKLSDSVADFGRRHGAESAVGGPGGLINDYSAVTNARLPLIIAVLAAVSFLVLIVILRAIVLPAICVVLNLLTVGVSFGVMSALFTGEHPPLGGPGFIDVISLLGTFTIVFSLSIDYQVFLLARMREELDAGGDPASIVHYGLRSTASVITGAAAIMVGVFLAFAASPFAPLRQTGVGLAVAVFLDATIVRLVLLPWAMRLAGRSTWWLPRPLERILPRLSA